MFVALLDDNASHVDAAALAVDNGDWLWLDDGTGNDAATTAFCYRWTLLLLWPLSATATTLDEVMMAAADAAAATASECSLYYVIGWQLGAIC